MPDPFRKAVARVVCGGGLLFLFLFAIRIRIVGFNPRLWERSFFAGYYDVLYCLILVAIFLLLLWTFRRNNAALRTLPILFLLVCSLSILIAMANVKIVWLLARPLTYQWLYYSDFFQSLETRNAVFGILSGRDVVKAIAVLLSFVIISLFAYFYHSRSRPVIILLLLYLVSAYLWIHPRKHREFYANPVLYFASSVVQATRAPALLTMKAPPFEQPPPVSNAGFRPSKKLNVVIFVLESVPAHYLELYGGKLPLTPNITAAAKDALYFENFYAHSPSSTASLVSLLLSIYPNLSYRHLTEISPDIEFPSLSAEMKKHGYHTAYFNSADNRFHRAGDFLTNRGFDQIHDYRTIPCARRISAGGGRFQEGADDGCTMEAFLKWQNGKQLFFAIIWNMMTHFPYFLPAREIDYGVKYEPLHRYLNALRYADEQFGQMMMELKRRAIADSTIVIVVGDHGESFGEHRVYGHTKLYENTLRVPLLLINSNLFDGAGSETIGGLIDLAPTILDLAGETSPPEWQGRSLFNKRRQNRVYFFSPWHGFLFGFREGDTKFVYDGIENTSELYDLAIDPTESNNLTGKNTRHHQERLASWAQYQQAFMKSLK